MFFLIVNRGVISYKLVLFVSSPPFLSLHAATLPKPIDPFRDFGILPDDIAPPTEVVRASFPKLQIFGQYFATGILTCVGIGLGSMWGITLPFPWNILASVGALLTTAYLIYIIGRNDYRWVELHGDMIRAKHLYTGRIIERSIDEIEDLLTLVFGARTLTTLTTDALIGRVRGIMIRFHDQRTPLQICRADPAMTNAKPLIEAIIYRMSQHAPVDAEIIDRQGKPIIRRIHWKF